MLKNKQTRTWLVDASLLIAFLIEFYLNLTGVDLHQWIGITVGIGVIYHLVTHWNWVESVIERFFHGVSWRMRWYALLDASLLLGMALIIETGLILSTWFNITLSNYDTWKDLHAGASIVTLVLLSLKLSLHWRWIAKTGAAIVQRPPNTATAIGNRVIQPTLPSRRSFLTVIGLTTLAALFSIRQVVAEDSDTFAETITTETTAATQDRVASLPQYNDSSSSTASCSVQCNRRCSYPGHCRRYVDSNGNNKCDLGECL